MLNSIGGLSGLDIIQAVNENFHNLSHLEKDIVNYVLNNPKKVSTMRIQDLSKETFSSISTISRLVRKLGYANFAELKYAIKVEMRASSDYASDTLDANMVEKIEQTIQSFYKNDLDKLYSILNNSGKIYCYGTGWGQSVAISDFSRNMIAIGKPIIQIHSEKELEILINNHIQKDDVLMIVSLSGEVSDLAKKLKILKARKISLVSITQFSNNLLSRYADINLYFETEEFKIGNKNVTSFTPLLFLLDLIVRNLIIKE